MKSVTIYGLKEPGKEIRYIGQTVKALSRRLAKHYSDSIKFDARLQRWIRSVVSKGSSIEIQVIVENAVLHETEKEIIADYKSRGFDLVNSTIGGEGNHGYKWTEEQLQNISNIRKGRVITDEWKKNISLGSKGKRKPDGFGEKVSAGKLGKKFTEEHRKNIGKASLGRRFTMPDCAKEKIRQAKIKYWAELKKNV